MENKDLVVGRKYLSPCKRYAGTLLAIHEKEIVIAMGGMDLIISLGTFLNYFTVWED